MRGRAVRHQTVVASQGQTVMRVPGRWPGLPLSLFGAPQLFATYVHLPHTTPTLSSASMPSAALRGPFVHYLLGGQGPPVLEES